MIVFDLRCSGAGHVFEAWFGTSYDYEDQRGRGLIGCPICGDTAVDKAVMAPNVGPKGNRASAASNTAVALPADSEAAPTPEAMKTALAALAQMQTKLLEGSDWVGRSFAEEARAIHHGERAVGPIHGEASTAEAEALIEEGIAIAPLPFPVAPPETCN